MRYSVRALVCFIIILGTFSASGYDKIEQSHIEIIRDHYGTPYIYAKTDAEVAYGLATANAEDAFAVMQEIIISGMARYGEVIGKEGAKSAWCDFTYTR